MSAIHIKDGTWEEIIEGLGPVYRIFIYDNKFICGYDEEVIEYSLTGDKKKYYLEKDLENAEVSIQFNALLMKKYIIFMDWKMRKTMKVKGK